MNTNIHLKGGSPVYIETYDLYDDSEKVKEYTQIIKIRGVDSNGGKFDITLFGDNAFQSPISIENMDDTDIRINGSGKLHLPVQSKKEEVE